ncbi:helix-turn-helix domain-containing protein [Nocardia neocaledoniensis]|uniref:helix-turn-helix domain-containing protein n=1 Tax=Nocardia neocaledoniensis TaxID=236511 RepID=UPI0024543614|nr:helix-turn-helix transcriptional regulator [Nocardia neocaledoniensis]
MSDLGDFIRRRRDQLGWNQLQLADRCGVSDKQVGRWESGSQVPTLTSASVLARALGVTLAELAGEVTMGLDIAGVWHAAWDTTRDGEPVINRHLINATQAGETIRLDADGDYLWTGECHAVDGAVIGTYRAIERGQSQCGALHFIVGDGALIGRWSGQWVDGLIGTGWGVLAREPGRADRLMKTLVEHDGPVTAWPQED